MGTFAILALAPSPPRGEGWGEGARLLINCKKRMVSPSPSPLPGGERENLRWEGRP